MTTLNVSFSPTSFPHQKRTDNQKNKKFFKDCIDAGVGISGWEGGRSKSSTVRSSRKNKLINYNLLNNIIDPAEAKRSTDPFDVRFENTPTEYRNYPLVNPSLNLLVGEERKRQFRPQFVVTSPDAVNEKLNKISDEFNSMALDLVIKGVTDEREIGMKIQEFESWRTHDYKDARERMANQVIQYLYHTQNLKEEFSKGFEDLLAVAEEIYVIDVIGREPRLRRGNPLNFYTLRGGESYKIEDNEIIVEDGYLPPGVAVDRYGEYLSNSDIDKIEGGSSYQSGASAAMGFDKQITNQPLSLDDMISEVGIGPILGASAQGTSYFGGSFDQEGNVRVVRVVWRGFRKVKILSYYDEDGEYVEDILPDSYEEDKERGEKVDVKWITEWYEGTKIADDIYVKMHPVELQIRNPDNLAASNPGIIGTSFNLNSFEARSLVDMTKEYQYLYNKIMNRTELAISKYIGKVGKLDLSRKPNNWDVNKWLYYIYNMNIQFEDPFNEGSKGAAQGKLSGNMSQSGAQTEIGDADYIQRNLEILGFLERRVDEITGITPQRKGAIDNRETVGGIERSVMQSSHITEKWFGIHDDTRIRALESLLEAAKVAWDDKSFVRSYVLDSQTENVLRFDANIFRESAYGGYLSADGDNDNTLEQIRSLAQPMLQNGATMDMVVELYRTKNIGDLHRKITRYEREIQEKVEHSQQQQMEAEQAAAEAEQELRMMEMDIEQQEKELDRELERYKADLDAQTKMDIERMRAEQKAGEVVPEDDSFEREKHRAEQDIKKAEISSKEKMEKQKLALEQKKIEAQKEIQKLKDKAAKERERIKVAAAKAKPKPTSK